MASGLLRVPVLEEVRVGLDGAEAADGPALGRQRLARRRRVEGRVPVVVDEAVVGPDAAEERRRLRLRILRLVLLLLLGLLLLVGDLLLRGLGAVAARVRERLDAVEPLALREQVVLDVLVVRVVDALLGLGPRPLRGLAAPALLEALRERRLGLGLARLRAVAPLDVELVAAGRAPRDLRRGQVALLRRLGGRRGRRRRRLEGVLPRRGDEGRLRLRLLAAPRGRVVVEERRGRAPPGRSAPSSSSSVRWILRGQGAEDDLPMLRAALDAMLAHARVT